MKYYTIIIGVIMGIMLMIPLGLSQVNIDPSISTKETEVGYNKKLIEFSSTKELFNEDVGVIISEKYLIRDKNRVEIYWIEEKQYMDFTLVDINKNGIYDYVEWVVPHFSNQSFLIEIIDAHHLDTDKSFIANIYEDLRVRDGNWTNPIYHQQYIRAWFEENLTSIGIIEIYVKNVDATNTRVDLFHFNTSTLIGSFPIITTEDYYYLPLTNLFYSDDKFDFRINNIDGNSTAYLEFDYIVDPDTWDFTIRIYDTKETITRGDDILVYINVITCNEGEDKTTCRFGENITELNMNTTYFLQIQGNTSEADFNYDADSVFDTLIVNDEAQAECNDVGWDLDDTSSKQFIIKENYVPDDFVVLVSGNFSNDIFFWTDENATVDMNVDFTNDSLTYEEYKDVCTSTYSALSYSSSESVTLDADPESAEGWIANTDRFETGNNYFWGVIFTVDNDWTKGDVNSQYFKLDGEGGDSETQVGWSWIVNGTIIPSTISYVRLIIPHSQNYPYVKLGETIDFTQ